MSSSTWTQQSLSHKTLPVQPTLPLCGTKLSEEDPNSPGSGIGKDSFLNSFFCSIKKETDTVLLLDLAARIHLKRPTNGKKNKII